MLAALLLVSIGLMVAGLNRPELGQQAYAAFLNAVKPTHGRVA